MSTSTLNLLLHHSVLGLDLPQSLIPAPREIHVKFQAAQEQLDTGASIINAKDIIVLERPGNSKSGVARMNAPDRFELFLLGDGEKKCSEIPDTRTANSSVFTFNKEDHTLANILRAHLLKDPHVTFAGYKIPHPLFATFELRVQTDGSLTPKEALVNTCKNLVQDLEILSREFTKEFELRKMVMGDAAATEKQ